MHPILRLAVAGIGWGFVTDQILSDGWGLGVPAAVVLLLVAGTVGGVRPAPEWQKRTCAALAVLLVAATAFAIRESTLVRLTVLGSGFVVAGWAVLATRGETMAQLAGLGHLARRLVDGTVFVIHEAPPIRIAVPSGTARVGRGLALAIPIATVFLLLFTSADPVLGSSLASLAAFDAGAIVEHAVGTGFFTWIGLGAMVAVWRPVRSTSLALPAPGRVEALTVALTLTAVFATAVAFQSRYLFGGDAYLFEVAGLTRAEYARRGFFELLAIALLAIPVIVWLRRPGTTGRGEPALTGLLLGLVAMLGVVLISAAHRLVRYHEAFGMSELRFFSGVVELWLGGTLVWLALVVALGRVERFLAPVTAWGVALVLATAAVNPAGLIQRANIERAVAGAGFDAEHAVVALGADGRAALLAGFDRLPPGAQCDVVAVLHDRGRLEPRRGFAWTWSRAKALALPDPVAACREAPEGG